MVLAFFGETVSAGQIAVMGDMETKSLDHSLALFKVCHIIFINVSRKQLFVQKVFLRIP